MISTYKKCVWMGYKPICENREARKLSCYLVLSPEKDLVAIIHAFITSTGFRVDLYERGILSFQNRVVTTDFATVLGATNDISGAIIDGIKIYRRGVKVDKEDETKIRPHESKYYLPGLDRLKALKYDIVKAL